MFGTKPKHRIFSAVMFVFAAAVFINNGFDVYNKQLVAVDMVKDIGWFLIFLSLGLFPQFFSVKEAKEAKAARDSKLGKISAQLLPVGFFLWGIAVFAELVL